MFEQRKRTKTKLQQGTFDDSGFEAYRTVTRRERFLAEMERFLPRGKVCELIELVYPNPGGPGGNSAKR